MARRAGLALVLLCACAEPAPPPPNILLLVVDTLNRSALRPYEPSAPLLPALETLAGRSVRFDGAVSTASWTLPAQASILTGLYPDRHGATDGRVGIARAAPRLAGLLRQRGYQTVGFTDGGWLGPRFGFAEGFDRYDTRAAGPALAALPLPRDGAANAPRGHALFDRALAYLDARPRDAPPFFLFLQTFSVHDYFGAHPWATRRLAEAEERSAGEYLGCLKGELSCSAPVFARLEKLYRAELAHFDLALDRLLDRLEELGLSEETVVMLLSDHGEGFDVARGRIHHGGRLHADLVRVPLLLRIPGRPAGVVTAPVSLVDVMPTLLELAGAAVPEGLDGRSLLPLLDAAPAGDAGRVLFAMDHHYRWEPDGRRVVAERVESLPLAVAAMGGEGWYIRGPDGEEFYAASDAEQRVNRSDDAQSDLRDAAAARVRPRPSTPAIALDAASEAQLRSLGYLE